MASSHVWNVNKYRSEFESEEHWQLRKKFMETHMDKFPEDKLVCLARVFFNVEFLGCRYPEKTMRIIAELSKGVADEHREKQKGKLKRTFVQASDAAGARIKGTQLPEPQKKIVKTNEGRSDYCSAHINFTRPLPQPSESGEFPGLVIFENCNINGQLETCPFNILTHSVQKCRQTITISTNGRKCEIKINNKLLASEEGPTAKEARLNAAIAGLTRLRKSCYTIQVKRAFISNGPSISKDSKVTETEIRLPQDNIGSRMMQKMGWSGSGLGKSQQGIEDPIKAAPQIVNRAGLGCVNQKDLQSKFTKVFKDYIRSDAENDLVFSPDFSAEERKILHRNGSDPETRDGGDDGYDSDDLFRSDTERDCKIDTEDDEDILPTLCQENLCYICSKLRLVTGEETDDDIYDNLWNISSKTPVLSLINEHSDEGVNIFEKRQIFPSKVQGNLESENIGNQPAELVQQTSHVPYNDANILKSNSNKTPIMESLKIFLPDGSYKLIPFAKILANKELREFVKYSDGKTSLSYRHFATAKDLKTNSALKELFSDFISFNKRPEAECKASEKQNEIFVVKEIEGIPNYESKSFQAYKNEINVKDMLDTLPQVKPKHSDIRNTFTLSKQQQKNRKIRIFLPDGTGKRISIKAIEASQELMNILSKSKLSDEDFIHSKILQHTFFDYWTKIKNKKLENNLKDNNHSGSGTNIETSPSPIEHFNVGVNFHAAESSLIRSTENIFACPHSSTMLSKESDVKSDNNSTMSQAVTEIEYITNDRSSTYQTSTEIEGVSNDKSTTYQTSTGIEGVSNDKSTTYQTSTGIEGVSNDKSTTYQTSTEIEGVSNDKSTTYQTSTGIEGVSNDKSTTYQTSTGTEGVGNDKSTTCQTSTEIECVSNDKSVTYQTYTEIECVSNDKSSTYQTATEIEYNRLITHEEISDLNSDNQIKSDNICTSGNIINNDGSCTPTSQLSTSVTNSRNRKKRIKFVLPDGTFIRIPLDRALSCKEMQEYVKAKGKRCIPLKVFKTSAIKQFFVRFLTATHIDEIIQNSESMEALQINKVMPSKSCSEIFIGLRDALEELKHPGISAASSGNTSFSSKTSFDQSLSKEGCQGQKSEEKWYDRNLEEKQQNIPNSCMDDKSASSSSSLEINHLGTNKSKFALISNAEVTPQFKNRIETPQIETDDSTFSLTFQKHLLEPGPDACGSSLENHINSAAVTTIHSNNPVSEESVLNNLSNFL